MRLDSKFIFVTLLCTAAFLSSQSYGQKQCGMEPSQAGSLNMDHLATLDLTISGLAPEPKKHPFILEPYYGADMWGWTDPDTGKEYALVGLTNKTSVVDLSNPSCPKHVADIKVRNGFSGPTRDIKTYKNKAYMVTESAPVGLEVFDLTRLRDLKTGGEPAILDADFHMGDYNSHNLAINEDSGFAYVLGSAKFCGGGPMVYDLKTSGKPTKIGCIPINREGYDPSEIPFGPGQPSVPVSAGKSYVHDMQCVIYAGPDQRYQGREICVASSEFTINILDLTDKKNPIQISKTGVINHGYIHQAWIDPTHQFVFLGDELDEMQRDIHTLTYYWDLRDLEDLGTPEYFYGETKSVDHNLFIRDGLMYQANYRAGVRVIDISGLHIADKDGDQRLDPGIYGTPMEVANYDPYLGARGDGPMGNDETGYQYGDSFNGVFGVYPFFKNHLVVASTMEGRLLVLRLKQVSVNP